MTVQDTVTVTVPRQAQPAKAPLTRVPSAAADVAVSAPLLGRDRPLTTDERQFVIGLAVHALALGTIIVAGLLLGQYAWG